MKVLIALFLLACCYLPTAQADYTDLSLKDVHGKSHPLSQYIGKGKWVILNIWGTRCPPCLEEIPELQSFYQQHKDKDAVVVGVAIDYPSFGYPDPKQIAKFTDDWFIDYPVLLGDESLLFQLNGSVLQGTPTSYVYDPRGKLAAIQLGAVTQKVIEDFIKRYDSRH